MARRWSISRIKSRRSYTVDEFAQTVGVSISTVRNWVRGGLPILTEKRPFLILGGEASAYLKDKSSGAKTKLGSGQVYCVGCRAARTVDPALVEVCDDQGKRPILRALCGECGAIACRLVSKRDAPDWVALADAAKSTTRTDYTNLQTGT